MSRLRSEIPESLFGVRGYYRSRRTEPGHTYVKHSYLINEDIASFDSEFFGIKLVEAKAVDPQ